MPELRWSLVLIGMVLLGAIYLASEYAENIKEWFARMGQSVKSLFAGRDSVGKSKQRVEPSLGSNSHQNSARASAERIIVMHVMAQSGDAFAGLTLQKALINCGCEFGEMDIYHHHVKTPDGKQPVFSVANMLEPGTFPIQDFENFATPGLTFILQLPTALEDLSAFDLTLEQAEKLVTSLNGVLLDETRAVMSDDWIDSVRTSLGATSSLAVSGGR